MALPLPPRRARSNYYTGLALLISLSLAQIQASPLTSCPAVVNTRQEAQPAQSLKPGIPIERELVGGQAHSYLVTLTEGQLPGTEGEDEETAPAETRSDIGEDPLRMSDLRLSKWAVSDKVTRELMVAYFSGLKQGQGRSEALRRVQLKMIANPRRQHPFYWAAFIQSGEWAKLEGRR